MTAIGHEVRARNPRARICYVHAERFVSDLDRSRRSKSFGHFREQYHTLDLLLLDDVQCLRNGPDPQDALLGLMDVLMERRLQVVIASDAYPRDLPGFMKSLTSRFGWWGDRMHRATRPAAPERRNAGNPEFGYNVQPAVL